MEQATQATLSVHTTSCFGAARALSRVLACALTLSACAWAQPLFALPGATAREAQGSVTVTYAGRTLVYVLGMGWLGEDLAASASAPVLEGDTVYLQGDVLDALGVTLPRLTGVRSSRRGAVRLVFDLEGVDEVALEGVRRTGTLSPQQPLTLDLPPLLLPRELPAEVEGVRVAARVEAQRTRLELYGPAASYEVFALREPSRVVVDLTADATAGSTAADARLDLREHLLSGLAPETPQAPRTLAPGVTLRRFAHPTATGTSRVDLVEIAPGSGRFEVVQAPAGTGVLSDLAAGALVGLNASYFNTETGQAIGFLKTAGETRSLPTRNRAAIGFGFGRPLIGRLQAELRFSLNGRPYHLPQTGRVTLFTTPGKRVGSPRWGALVVRGERVLENKVGPRTVPPGGFVLSYAPEERPLALLDTGDRLTFELQLTPRAFAFTPEAVEAGPLLVQRGEPAYDPELEAFDPLDPESNVNRRTTRAAVGVREDGTVLLLTATDLTAAELVPLFLSLGAESALQMDSGGSSTLFAAGEVINRPAFSQRPIATAVVFSPSTPSASLAARGEQQDDSR